MHAHDASSETRGSPYDVPVDELSRARLDGLLDHELDLRQRLEAVKRQLEEMNLLVGVRAVQTTREVFESNKIEGVGPDIGRTHEILSSREHAQATLDHEMFSRAVSYDQDLTDVLGLMGARRLALKLSVGAERPITEMDIRTLHSWICSKETHAGMYKRFHVTIQGSRHEPLLPIDVPAAMSDLVRWLRSASGSIILRASIAHAWLTHIHPFEDGNGRIARLLANIVLRSGGLPPAIVKHSSQRGPYLDALSHSDAGGDILPFAAVFRRSLSRYIREVEHPEFLEGVFDRELANRGSTPFEWWTNAFRNFIDILRLELSTSGIGLREAGSLDDESFALLRNRDSTGNTWVYFIHDHENHVLLWLGYASSSLRTDAAPEELYPSMYFSTRRTDGQSYKPYRRLPPLELDGLEEMHLLPGLPTSIYARLSGRTIVESVDRGATRLAAIAIRKLREMSFKPAETQGTQAGAAWETVFSGDH